ncbi:uncharacterized protein [Miscanthus floridulus]|uniref:uncharacterized protein n=1 Tax=Miscanthus floridulus TaxID=154761 RepID=UPI00345ABB67
MEAFAVLGNGAEASAFIGRGPGRFLGKEDESGREGQKAWARGEERNDVVSLTCGIRNVPVRSASPTLHTELFDMIAFTVNFVLVTNLSTGATKGGWDIPEIKFRHIPDEFIDRVVNQGDMTCVAGGEKLTHPSVQPFIKELVGTVDSVRGLPRELTEKLIRESLQEE